MVFCFAFECSHRASREKCSFFRFPVDKPKQRQWERLCRRGDRALDPANDRLCSCHFVDNLKENGPSIFNWNRSKIFDFPEVSSCKAKPKRKSSQDEKTEQDDSCSYMDIRETHNYAYTCPSGSCTGRLQDSSDQISALKEQIQELNTQLEEMSLSAAKRKPMTLDQIKDNPDKMLLYTSVPYDIFIILVSSLKRFDLDYFYGWKVKGMDIETQLLITLMKLRLNLRDLDLAERFCTSRTTIANILKTFICALHELVFKGVVSHRIPSQAKCKGSMPKSFDEFSSARIVMDATEITQDVPRELNKNAACYSSYKSRHTVKALTCVAPNGAIVFCSDLYPGSVSDVVITEHCRVLESMEPGDLILADKGFTVHRFLPTGVNLNIPPFLSNKVQFTKEEAQLCHKIARARIHVERANERIKNFEILNHIPANMRPFSTRILQLCCGLVDLQATLLSEIGDEYECN